MAHEYGYGDKVYSSDLQTFSLEGTSGIFGTVASLLVGPIRLLSRVTNNIMVLPANLLESYADGVVVIGAILAALGVVDWLVFDKWQLLI